MNTNTFSKYKYSSFNEIVILLISFVSLFAFTLLEEFIPDRFLTDSHTIRDGMVLTNTVSKSVLRTINFYKFIGMGFTTPTIIINIFSWIVFVLILLTFLRLNKQKNFSIYQLLCISFFSFMYFMYFTNYSKDIIVLIFFIIAINMPKMHNNLLINIIIVIGIYGAIFRKYWLIVFIISLFVIFDKHVNWKHYIINIFLLIVLFIALYEFKGGNITNIRIYTNLLRVNTSNAKSIINNIVVNKSILSNIINYVYVLISLIFPIQGLPSFNVIFYYLWIWSLILFIIKNKNIINFKLFIIFIVFVNVQALFEPDFGSVLRHQMAWMPVIFCCTEKFNSKKEISESYNGDK